jgi:ribosomal protein L37AE/L43A
MNACPICGSKSTYHRSTLSLDFKCKKCSHAWESESRKKSHSLLPSFSPAIRNFLRKSEERVKEIEKQAKEGLSRFKEEYDKDD